MSPRPLPRQVRRCLLLVSCCCLLSCLLILVPSPAPSLTSPAPEVWVPLEQCGCQRRLPSGPGPGEVSLESTTCSRAAHSRGGGQQVGGGQQGAAGCSRGRQE